MAEHTGLFVHEQDVLVLVDDVEPRCADLEVAVLLARLFKKLVVNIEVQHVALGDARIAFCALAVELYALQPYVFLQQGFGQKRHRFAHEAVQPLPCVIFTNSQLFHK